MKKLLLIYVSILIGVYALLSMLGRDDDYAIEQKLWKIHKQYSEITKDPSVVPEQNFIDVANAYEDIAKKYPKSALMPGVHILIGDVYMIKKDYATARTKFENILKLFPDKNDLLADANSRVAKTYELEGNWAKAQSIYKDVLKRWPETVVGLGVPLYLANYHKSKNDFQNTMTAYQEAISYYKGVAASDTSSLTGFNARRLLATCYLDLGRWKDAIEALSSILNTYALSTHLTIARADQIIKTINVVAAFQLDNYDIARAVYKDFTTRHPQHPLSAYMQRMIEAFNELDAKGVRVSNQTPQQ